MTTNEHPGIFQAPNEIPRSFKVYSHPAREPEFIPS